MSLLKIDNLSVAYGRNVALDGVSINVPQAGLIAVLGANGAGKSSLLKCIAGIQAAKSGKIEFSGQDITSKDTAWRVEHGVALVPEGRRILVSMTVHENLQMGTWCRREKPSSAEFDAIYDRFPNLARRRHMSAAVLSGGEQQMLAIGRALMAKPSVLLLDEPSLGLSPLLVQQLFELIQSIHQEGKIGMVLVEQNIHKALQYASYVYLLELGKLAAHGTSAEMRKSEALHEAYLGKD